MRIGILGGTFDPVHRGHTELARQVRRAAQLDRVLFMVCRRPPHKVERVISSAYHRFAMVALETAGESAMIPSVWELERSTPSYTIETLRFFESAFPEDEFCFIAGSDSLREVHLWKDYDKLLAEHCFLFVQRPGSQIQLGELEVGKSLKQVIHPVTRHQTLPVRAGVSYLLSLDTPPISSTAIRAAYAARQDPPPGSLSSSVREYITKCHLYEQNKESSGKGLRRHR